LLLHKFESIVTYKNDCYSEYREESNL